MIGACGRGVFSLNITAIASTAKAIVQYSQTNEYIDRPIESLKSNGLDNITGGWDNGAFKLQC